jgi:Xaa-Pro aminopeptidase
MHWSEAPGARGFPIEERDRRWQRTRELMAERSLDVLLAFPQWYGGDALYLANQNGFVYFPLEGEPVIVIGGEDSNRAIARKVWIDDRRSASETGSTRVEYGAAAARVLKEKGADGKRIGLIGMFGTNYTSVRTAEGYLNYSSVVRVQEAVPKAEIVDATDVISELRHVKSDAELDVLRESVRVGEASANAMLEHARIGALQAEVHGLMLLEQMKHGVSQAGAAWCPGGWGEPKHRYTQSPPGRIEPGLYVCTEIMAQVRGYGAQIAEPLVIGEPTDEAYQTFELNQRIIARAMELMRPGNTWGQVEEGTAEVLQGTGFRLEFLMHGQGLGNDGPLLIPTDVHTRTWDDPVRERSTFVLKPSAFPARLGEHDTARAHDVTWGDTVVVTEHGAERLGTRPMTLNVVK